MYDHNNFPTNDLIHYMHPVTIDIINKTEHRKTTHYASFVDIVYMHSFIWGIGVPAMHVGVAPNCISTKLMSRGDTVQTVSAVQWVHGKIDVISMA